MKLKPLAAALAITAIQFTLCTFAQAQQSQMTTLTRATELRNDKLGSAQVMASLPVGASVRVASIEGGWALVEAAGQTGWVRAGTLALQAQTSAAAGAESGRTASGNTALTLGVRSLPPRVNRHALIIGVSRYADTNTPPLPGARIDRQSATQMAQAMQVPVSNIKYLQDEEATGDNIRAALKELNSRVMDGDRVFVHYSGHGTRYNDPAAGGCVEALLAYDGGNRGTITNREISELLKPITQKTDKLFVMYDACHSGGLVPPSQALRTRGISNPNDDGILRPKFSSISEECGRPVNIKTRNLVVEQVNQGALPQDIIHLSASRDNEISFDDELKGGLATQFMRDCMLRDARDLDGSGAISIDEIKACAQEKINKRMQNDPNFKPHNITLSGNAAFVPAWFAQAPQGVQVASNTPVAGSMPAAPPAPPAPAPAAAPAAAPQPPRPPQPVAAVPVPAPAPAPAPAAVIAAPPKPTQPVAVAPTPAPTPAPAPAVVAPSPAPAAQAARPPAVPAQQVAVVTPAPTPAPAPAPVAPVQVAVAPVAPPPALTGEQALRQMFDQRDAKRQVNVTVSKDRLKIGQDVLSFSVKSDRPGYLYVALAGSDNKSVYLLFPNDLDQNNRVEAGQTIELPRPNWRVRASGPEGRDSLLVMVTDGPRDLRGLSAAKVGPFVSSLNDADGRARLGSLMTTSSLVTSQACTTPATRRNNPVCSDAYGATMLSVEEVK